MQDEMKNVAQPYSRNKRSPVPIKDETHLLGPSLGTLTSRNISFMGPDPQLRSKNGSSEMTATVENSLGIDEEPCRGPAKLSHNTGFK